MKKLLFVLLIVAVASYFLVGCLPVTPSEGDGEGEGECEVTVVIDDAVVIDGKTYVSCGNHEITVTFCTPVAGYADAYITCCSGYYGSMKAENNFECDSNLILFPNADKTVWTGSGYFGCDGQTPKGTLCPCCASYVEIYSGECEDEACIWFPVIVDCDDPFALIKIGVENCECEGCEITFEAITLPGECYPDLECCGDYCSGLASWSILLYDVDPFDECCDPSICEEPIVSCSGTACPIECVTDCLTAGTYYAVITLVDNVGNKTVYYAKIVVSGGGATEDCDIDVYEGFEAPTPTCVTWDTDTSDMIGICYSIIQVP